MPDPKPLLFYRQKSWYNAPIRGQYRGYTNPMSPESTSIATKMCPTCGTRLSEDATRCLVCGAELGSAVKPAKPAKAVQGSRMPEITLSLPAAIGLLALFLTIGAVMVFLALRSKPEVVIPITPSATSTTTATATTTPTDLPPTATFTPMPSPTPLSYSIVINDTCLGIALHFGVAWESIRSLNNLGVECLLRPGTSLLIPQPTPTPTPLPTNTQSPEESTRVACKTASHTVVEGETLSIIAQAYGVSMAAIKEENGLSSDSVFTGSTLTIPLCKRPTPQGPTPTITPPPPYPAPNLLLPPNGSPFTLADDTITLQWASVGNLRENEAYAVSIEDLTDSTVQKLVEYVTDTKYMIPASIRPGDKTPHVFGWTVTTVRQNGTTADGKPIWVPAGTTSDLRVFSWSGAPAEVTPTP